MRYYRTTGLVTTQMQELVRRVNNALDKPWNKHVGRPKSLGLYKAVEAGCMYLRQNATQEFIGDSRDTSQPTISRYVAALVPLVKSVLEEFVPSAADAIEIVKGRVVLVDGTLTPCWSYEDHQELWNKKHQTTGFNAQLISLLDGTAAWISGPLPGKTHDAKAFKETGAADILKKAGGGSATKATRALAWSPQKRSRKAASLPCRTKNTTPRSHRFARPWSASWATSKTGRYSTQTTAAHTILILTRSMPPVRYSSSQSHGVLNNAPCSHRAARRAAAQGAAAVPGGHQQRRAPACR